MNRIMKKTGTGIVQHAAFGSWLSRGAITLLAIAGFMSAPARANAACGDPIGQGSKSPIRLPMLAQAGNDQGDSFLPGSGDSIVGLWHVVYTANGGTFNETLDQWHSDGTEFENAWMAPDTGNICFGVWKLIAPHTVRLHHIGWLFTPGSDPGTATGTFTLGETDKVSRDGKTYTGTFTFKTFRVDGSSTGVEVNGTIVATRITVD